MKNIIAWSTLFILATALVACSSSPLSNNPPSESEPGAPMLAAQDENALPVELQLAFGILSLEDTQNEVDAQMAAQLLPLWKALRSLNSSDTVAQAEVQALYKQIQETMTPQQIQAIADMRLTRENMAEISEKLGLQFGPGGGRFENLSPEMQATLQAARESGQAPPGRFGEGGGIFIPGGGPGEGGGFGSGGGAPNQGVSPERQATMEARRASARNTIGIPTPILEAVIEYLEGKLDA